MSIKLQVEINELRNRVESLEQMFASERKKKPGPRKGWKNKKVEDVDELSV